MGRWRWGAPFPAWEERLGAPATSKSSNSGPQKCLRMSPVCCTGQPSFQGQLQVYGHLRTGRNCCCPQPLKGEGDAAPAAAGEGTDRFISLLSVSRLLLCLLCRVLDLRPPPLGLVLWALCVLLQLQQQQQAKQQQHLCCYWWRGGRKSL